MGRSPSSRSELEPASYPMVDEDEATGRVAGVYADILSTFPMVPSLFKSFAVSPTYLELAWDQSRRVLGDDDFAARTRRVVDEAADVVPPHPDSDVRALLGRFVGALGKMLLLTSGLRLALDGVLDATPAAPMDELEQEPDLRVALDVPPTSAMRPADVGMVRSALATPIVNSIWRVAADRGLLAEAWRELSAHLASPDFVERSDQVRRGALRSAREIGWDVVASRQALANAGLPDGAAGIDAILDAYLMTLPRVLTLVAANEGTHEDD